MALSSHKNCPNCGSDHKSKPFAIYEDGFQCFSCGYAKRSNYDFKSHTKKVAKDVKIPPLITNPSKFPLKVLERLKEFHVTDELIYKYHICATEDISLFFPVIVDGVVVKTQQRWFEPRRDYAQGNFRFKPIIDNDDDTIVLVEDCVSFIRVGENYSCCCLFGTSIDNENLKQLLSKYTNIIIWLDNDHTKERNAGQIAADKICKKLNNMLYYKYSLSNKVVYNVITDNDPKYYTNSQIKDIIRSTLCSQLKQC